MSTIEETKSTKASIFIIPMLGFSRNYYEPFITNCYIGDGEKPEYDKHIFILMKFSSDTKYGWLERSMEAHEEFTAKYDLENGKYTMFVFKVADKFKKDFEHFKVGSFSKFSTFLKHEILRLNEFGPDTNVASALSKGKKLRKYWEEQIGAPLPDGSEVMAVPKLKYEIFNFRVEEGYPNYSYKSEDGVFKVRFNPDPDNTYLICQVTSYYKYPEKIAKAICEGLDTVELDLTI